MYLAQPNFVTLLSVAHYSNIRYIMENIKIRIDKVTHLNRHRSKPVTVLVTRPLELVPFFVEYRLSLRCVYENIFSFALQHMVIFSFLIVKYSLHFDIFGR